MITCNLNKPESTFNTIRKAYEDLKPTDVALIATALVESGRFADAVHDGQEFSWTPDQYEALTQSLSREVAQMQNEFEHEKASATKRAKAADEEINLIVNLKPSVEAGEVILGERDDLKTVFGDILNEGVEFLYGPNDIGWHWTVSRINWTTATGSELKRRVRFGAEFVAPHTALEVSATGKKKKR